MHTPPSSDRHEGREQDRVVRSGSASQVRRPKTSFAETQRARTFAINPGRYSAAARFVAELSAVQTSAASNGFHATESRSDGDPDARCMSIAIMSRRQVLPCSTQRLTTASNRPGATVAIAAHRLALARLLELQIGVAAQLAARRLCLLHPAVEVGGAHAEKLEAHVGEAGAAVVGGKALVLARPVDDRVQLGLHARHRVDLAGQRRNEERVHHGRRRDLEADGHVHRRRQLVDDGDALLGIDEQPFPVEGDDLDDQRFSPAGNGPRGIDPCQRPIGVERVRADPGQRAQRMMISSGAAQISSSSWMEWSQSGV